ncbi:hypothetical protein TUZN_0922 [Thermoproteus uzoniensis 768-20]|uniref:von Willebrand factor, type A n=1 Tax=Thermoproteus uzoniensis (strain 768-20) TaxID=999630 RepID=F2L5W0_THEU7|nr:VWA domain-containing protein [Thermoproteus uzoniensis]AEA12405.1 hypothetical protein TUZN_0922 [Thermoproteus uzoniensis 768-20]
MVRLGDLEVDLYANNTPDGYLDVEVRLSARGRGPAPETNTAFAILIDKSKSMADFDKLAHAIEAAKGLVESMAPEDIVAVYVFDEKVKALVPPTPVEKARKMLGKIEKIKPGTYTLLYQALLQVIDDLRGIKRGLPLMPRRAVPENIPKRIVVITDGEPWPYYTEERWYEHLGKAAARYGITISAIGIGDDYNEKILYALANSSGGAWYHISQIRDISQVLANELRRAKTVVARRPKIAVEPSGAELVDVRKIGAVVSRLPVSKEVELEDVAAGDVISAVFRFKTTSPDYRVEVSVTTDAGTYRDVVTSDKLTPDRTATLTLSMAQELEKLAEGGVVSVEVLRAVSETPTAPEPLRRKAQRLLEAAPSGEGKEAFWEATVTLTLPVEEQQLEATAEKPAPQTPAPQQAGKCVLTCIETGKSMEVPIPALLGREDLQQIIPPEKVPYISRRVGERAHLAIYRGEDGIYIKDAGSKGGVYVEGKKVAEPLRLAQGAVVNLAGVVNIRIECS